MLRQEAAVPSKLLVTVLEVQNLPKMDLLGKCDPFVRVLLDGVVRQTRTLEKVLQCGRMRTYADVC